MLRNTCRRAADLLAPWLSRLGQKLRQDEDGQDLIEYALLTSIIAIVGILVFPSIQTLHDAYLLWNNRAQDLWIPDPPTT